MMAGSIASKAYNLLKNGNVDIDDPSFSKMHATVVTMTDGGTVNDYHVNVWRDGHWSCTCENFLYSKSEIVNYWEEGTRAKPECKHCLAVKLSPEYKEWIRMIVVPTNDGMALRAVELSVDIHVKSIEDPFDVKKLLPKVKTMPFLKGKTRVSFNDIFGDQSNR